MEPQIKGLSKHQKKLLAMLVKNGGTANSVEIKGWGFIQTTIFSLSRRGLMGFYLEPYHCYMLDRPAEAAVREMVGDGKTWLHDNGYCECGGWIINHGDIGGTEWHECLDCHDMTLIDIPLPESTESTLINVDPQKSQEKRPETLPQVEVLQTEFNRLQSIERAMLEQLKSVATDFTEAGCRRWLKLSRDYRIAFDDLYYLDVKINLQGTTGATGEKGVQG